MNVDIDVKTKKLSVNQELTFFNESNDTLNSIILKALPLLRFWLATPNSLYSYIFYATQNPLRIHALHTKIIRNFQEY